MPAMNPSTNQQHFSTTAPPVALHQTRVARTIELPRRFDVHADLDVHAMFNEAGTTLLIDGSNVAFADMSSLQSLVDARLTALGLDCLLYTSPSPRDRQKSRMPSSA